MRKNDLIKKLQEIDGNPNVVIWNGFVEDYNNISSVQEDYLYRDSKTHAFKIHNYRRELKGLEPIEYEDFEFKASYDFPNRFLDEEEMKEWYDNKMKIIIIEPKPRHKSTFDRLGEIEY